jgi:hypothetical protein
LRRTISLLTAAAAVVATMTASTSLAVAQGNPQGNPKALEGAQLVDAAACEPGQGETSGTKKPDSGTRPFGAVHEPGFFVPCSVPLPDAALFVEDPG